MNHSHLRILASPRDGNSCANLLQNHLSRLRNHADNCYPDAVFSSRLDWSLETNKLSALLKTKAHVLDLTESNPTRAGFVYPVEEILGALSDPRSLRYEPEPRGLLSAREAVSQ